jgi:hypothetical protein
MGVVELPAIICEQLEFHFSHAARRYEITETGANDLGIDESMESSIGVLYELWKIDELHEFSILTPVVRLAAELNVVANLFPIA